MKVIISNNYGGKICRIEFEKEDPECFGIGVKISGFIETTTTRIQHVTSLGTFVKDVLYFKVPRNIIPTFKNKSFSVEYIAECVLIYKMKKEKFSFNFDIFNNNLENFDYKDPINIDLSIVDEEEYIRNKEKACEILLESMDMTKNVQNFVNMKNKDSLKSKDTGSISFINKKDKFQGLSPSLSETQDNNIKNDNNITIIDNNIKNDNSIIDIKDENSIIDIKNDNSIVDVNNDNVTDKDSNIISIDKTTDFELNKIVNNNNDILDNLAKNLINKAKCDNKTEEISNELKEDLEKVISKLFEEKCKVDDKIVEELRNIAKNTSNPIFPERNVLRIGTNRNTFVVMEDDSKLAIVDSPNYVLKEGNIKLTFLKNVKNTQIQIWNEDFVEGVLMNAQRLFCMSFDSNDCLEKRIDFEIEGISLKTFAFKVSYSLNINMDGSEINIPLQLVSKNSIISYENE